MLKGSNLRNQADVVKDLAEKIRPFDLVDIVEKSDASRLATALDRDIGQMTRLLGHIADSAGLYDLDGIIFEDRLEITMYDEGVLKPVGQLSQGQMATALLPLILRPADYPLIFDQPEDDLDNRFIYKTLDRNRPQPEAGTTADLRDAQCEHPRARRGRSDWSSCRCRPR